MGTRTTKEQLHRKRQASKHAATKNALAAKQKRRAKHMLKKERMARQSILRGQMQRSKMRSYLFRGYTLRRVEALNRKAQLSAAEILRFAESGISYNALQALYLAYEQHLPPKLKDTALLVVNPTKENMTYLGALCRDHQAQLLPLPSQLLAAIIQLPPSAQRAGEELLFGINRALTIEEHTVFFRILPKEPEYFANKSTTRYNKKPKPASLQETKERIDRAIELTHYISKKATQPAYTAAVIKEAQLETAALSDPLLARYVIARAEAMLAGSSATTHRADPKEVENDYRVFKALPNNQQLLILSLLPSYDLEHYDELLTLSTTLATTIKE